MSKSTDFLVQNEGNIFLLVPLTRKARNWVKSKIDPDHNIFGNAVVVEHRYIADIVNGAQNDGLTII